jgi:hypothetical protein
LSLYDKGLSELTDVDLNLLIANKEAEGKTLEYKRDLVGKNDKAKKEFLADVSSFANASGGHLLFGIDAKDGVPVALTGFPGLNADQEILAMEQTLRDGVRPPISGIQTVSINLPGGGSIVVIRIPRSWNPPHQVVFQKDHRFYGRDSRGKYRLEVDELRGVFAFSTTAAERMRQFRADRIAKIIAGETPMRLHEEARMVVHFLPLAAFTGAGAAIDLQRAAANPRALIEMAGGGSVLINLDGMVARVRKALGTRYAQLFRNGCIEVISDFSGEANARQFLPSIAFERELINELRHGKELLRQLGIQGPLVMMVTLIGMEGWHIYSDDTSTSDTFDRDPVVIPELVLEGFDGEAAHEIKPLLDVIWNAAGSLGSPNYDGEGRRKDTR